MPRPSVRRLSDEEEAEIQSGIARDPENPELTEDELARLRPAREVLPPDLLSALAKRRRGQRGPQKTPTKKLVTLRLDPDVLDHFRASGPGWQSRLNETLRKAAGL
jgi:uncharacterized protein (DUF4415 family)